MKTIQQSDMKLDRVTKGAVLYKAMDMEDNPASAITSIYLRKSGLTEPYPTEITLRVQVVSPGGK